MNNKTGRGLGERELKNNKATHSGEKETYKELPHLLQSSSPMGRNVLPQQGSCRTAEVSRAS